MMGAFGEGAMMRRGMIGLVVALIGLLVGCAEPVSQPTGPAWTPTPEPAVSITPTPVSPWTPEEQAAIDAVTRYLAEWSRIGQNLETADWNDIRDVAVDPAAQNNLSTWTRWEENGWHLVGEQTFSPQNVAPDSQDDAGSWYLVDGCLSIVGSDIVDAQGQSAGGSDRKDISPVRFTVLAASTGKEYVSHSEAGQALC